jgi:hypothetical protein
MAKRGMDEIKIYKFQLEHIVDALQTTSRLHKSSDCTTCFDRDITQAIRFGKNALLGDCNLPATRFKEKSEENH